MSISSAASRPRCARATTIVVRRGRLFADTLRFTLTECGDYRTPIAQGVIAKDAVEGDLFDLCSGRILGRRSADEITVFKNGGGGHLDLIVARAIWDLCCAPGRDLP